jgi:hypothetical protein
MPLESFYSTAAQLFIALLGFWWVVAQFKHYRWSRDPARRRMSYVVSLHFLLPGIMCVISLLSGELQAVWNIAFAVAGVSGMIATAMGVAPARAAKSGASFELFSQGAAIGLYAFIALLAIFPGLPASVGLNVPVLVIEAILLTLLGVLSATIAWFLFMEPDQ